MVMVQLTKGAGGRFEAAGVGWFKQRSMLSSDFVGEAAGVGPLTFTRNWTGRQYTVTDATSRVRGHHTRQGWGNKRPPRVGRRAVRVRHPQHVEKLVRAASALGGPGHLHAEAVRSHDRGPRPRPREHTPGPAALLWMDHGHEPAGRCRRKLATGSRSRRISPRQHSTSGRLGPNDWGEEPSEVRRAYPGMKPDSCARG